MNYGKFGTNNTTQIKRSAFPYWGLSVHSSFDSPEMQFANKCVLQLAPSTTKGVKITTTKGSQTLFSPHIFNFGAGDVYDFYFDAANSQQLTKNYLKQRGENTYQYNPAKQGTQDAVKKLFIQFEGMEGVVPLNLRN